MPPYRDKTDGTCLTARELYDYVGTGNKLYYMRLENPCTYDVPYSLEEIGVKRSPQSWQYVDMNLVRALAFASRHADEFFESGGAD